MLLRKVKMNRFIKLSAIALLTAAFTAHAQKPVIIDTDIGDDIDDAFALALALRSPELKVIGVTSDFGDTTLRAHMIARMLESAGAKHIPVGIGVKTPPKTKFTQSAYAEGDKHQLTQIDAVDLILKAARKQPGKVTLIAIGPLTNVGAAIDRDPAAFRKLKQVVVMGGSIHRGYSNKGPEIEWNTRNSPKQTQQLLASGVPVYLFPLDSTQIRLPDPIRDKILATPGQFSKDLIELLKEGGRPSPKLYDAVAVSHMIQPTICPVKPMHIEVDEKGFTRETEGKPNANVCLVSDENAFLKLLELRLTK